MAQGRLWWASLCLCQLENPSKVQLKTRCYCYWTDLSWLNQVQEPQSHWHSWASAQHQTLASVSRTGPRAHPSKPSVLQNVCPHPCFSAAGLRFWFLSKKQTVGHIQPWLLYVVKGLLQLLQRARQEAFPWVTAPVVPNQDLAQAQKSNFHVLFSVTKSVPSPFHYTEVQMLLVLVLLLCSDSLVGWQLEITPCSSRVTKSRPWLLLLATSL